MSKRMIAVALGAAALLVPGTAAAEKGSGKDKSEKVAAKQEKKQAKGNKKKSKAKKGVSYIFKGTYVGAGVVTVKSGNAHVRKGDFVGQNVTFDMASAKVVAAEPAATKARRVIKKPHPPVEDETEATPAA